MRAAASMVRVRGADQHQHVGLGDRRHTPDDLVPTFGVIAQFAHFAQHRDALAAGCRERRVAQRFQRPDHGIRRGVVGVGEKDRPVRRRQNFHPHRGRLPTGERLGDGGERDLEMPADRDREQGVLDIEASRRRHKNLGRSPRRRDGRAPAALVPCQVGRVDGRRQIIDAAGVGGFALEARAQRGSERVRRRVNGDAVGFRQKLEQLALGAGNLLLRAQQLDMRMSYVGDDADGRRADLAQPQNLPRAAHSHFQHHRRVCRCQSEDGVREADLVVVVRGAFQNAELRSQHGCDHLFGRCLADTARNPDDRSREAVAHKARHVAERVKRVQHDDLRQIRRGFIDGRRMLDHQGERARFFGGVGVLVPVVRLTAQGDEQRAGLQTARVGRNRRDRLLAADADHLRPVDQRSARHLDDVV